MVVSLEEKTSSAPVFGRQRVRATRPATTRSIDVPVLMRAGVEHVADSGAAAAKIPSWQRTCCCALVIASLRLEREERPDRVTDQVPPPRRGAGNISDLTTQFNQIERCA